MKNKPSQPSFLTYPKVLDKKKTLAALAVKALSTMACSFFSFTASFSTDAFFIRCSFFLQRILVKGVEHGREVTLACVGENGYDGLALVLGTLCQLGSSKGGST